jgi:hypothetical protein
VWPGSLCGGIPSHLPGVERKTGEVHYNSSPATNHSGREQASIHSIYELMSWRDDYFKNENVYLEASNQVAREILEEQGGSKREV